MVWQVYYSRGSAVCDGHTDQGKRWDQLGQVSSDTVRSVRCGWPSQDSATIVAKYSIEFIEFCMPLLGMI